MSELQVVPGPCCVCGSTNYPPSMGGPAICPKCDCGHFDAATVLQQAKVIEKLRAALDAQSALLAEAKTALEHAKIDYAEIISYVGNREGTPYGLLQTQRLIEAVLAKLKAAQK